MTLAGHDPLESGRQIVWDGLGLEVAHSGIGYYARQLYSSLGMFDCEPFVTAPTEGALDFVSSGRLLKFSLISRAGRLKPIFPILSYRAAQRVFPSLVYHGLSNINIPTFVPKRRQDKFVITVHDTIPLIGGRLSMLGLQMRILLPKVIDVADVVLVPSKWTRDRLLEYVGVYAETKVQVIPNGTAEFFHGAAQPPEQSPPKSIDVLAVGRGESYKRLEYLLSLAKDIPNSEFAVVTDTRGAKILSRAPKNIKIYVGIGQEEIRALYLKSRVFAHPSLFEGWCLPVADALAAGLHVVYTKGSAVDEVCACAPNQSVGLSPSDGRAQWADAVSNAIKSSIENPYQIQELPSLPTWKNYAEKTLKIYKSLI